jgi:hypothetical protein
MDNANVVWPSLSVVCKWFLIDFFVSRIVRRVAAEATQCLHQKVAEKRATPVVS